MCGTRSQKSSLIRTQQTKGNGTTGFLITLELEPSTTRGGFSDGDLKIRNESDVQTKGTKPKEKKIEILKTKGEKKRGVRSNKREKAKVRSGLSPPLQAESPPFPAPLPDAPFPAPLAAAPFIAKGLWNQEAEEARKGYNGSRIWEQSHSRLVPFRSFVGFRSF